jgi:hypothetical protein
MGLDQYAFVESLGKKPKEIAYWRKHNRLQGFMENLWTEKTGKDPQELNCKELELTLEDLEQLEQDINSRKLPETTGFFFGSDSYEEYEQWYEQNDRNFIDAARKALSRGQKVVYTCWW